MIEKVKKLLEEFQGIEEQLASPENVADQKKFRELSIRHPPPASHSQMP